MLPFLQHLLATYGYIAVALGILVESMDVPLPGETLLLLGAAYAGAGNLSVWGLFWRRPLARLLATASATRLGIGVVARSWSGMAIF